MQKLMWTAVVACTLMSSRSAQAQVPSRSPQAPQRESRQLSRTQVEAQQACQNAINTRAGYQARKVGTPVQHGKKQWDVPVTVRRDGSETLRVSCRYNAANGKVTLRPRDQK
jgi:hypothetical protein